MILENVVYTVAKLWWEM